MAKVAEALKGLTSYLRAENARLDIEFKEQKIDLAAQNIANKFQNLPPDASPEQLQALQFELIGDAALYGALEENLPLISGLHTSALQTRSIVEAERHDEALAEAIQDQLGFDVGQMTGKDAVELFKTYESTKRETTFKDEAGRTFLEITDAKGKVTFEKTIDPLTRAQAIDEKFQTESNMAQLKSNLQLRNAMILQKQKQAYDADQLYGTAGVKKFAGFEFLRAQTTVDDEQLYTHKKLGGLFAMRSDGELVRHMGGVIPRKPSAKNVEDVISSLSKTQAYFGPQRFRAANELLETDAGRLLIQRITGAEGTENFTEENKAGQTVIRSGVLQQIETFLSQDKAPALLADMFSEEELASESGEMGAFNKFRLAYATEQSLNRQLFQNFKSTDKDQIIDFKSYNEGMNTIDMILDPNVPNEQAGGIIQYVNEKLGRDPKTVVTSQDIGLLKMAHQEYVAYLVSKYTDPDLRKSPAKTPTLNDITTPRKEDRTSVNKYPDKPIKEKGEPEGVSTDRFQHGESIVPGTAIELGWARFDLENPSLKQGVVDPFERFKLRK